MVYIKLENDMDKFMQNFKRFPKATRKIIFKSKCRNGNVFLENKNGDEFVILPILNDKSLKKLAELAKIRCWKNICVSSELENLEEIIGFAENSNLKIMNGKWLMKILADRIFEYIVLLQNDNSKNKEVTILCNSIDEICFEKIKEIGLNVKICNVLTNNQKQFKKLEEEFSKLKGTFFNVSDNLEKPVIKSNIIINFDFSKQELEKCIFRKNTHIINMCEIYSRKELRNIVFADILLPERFKKKEKDLNGFNNMALYESCIYKNTSYKNIKKEICLDNLEIQCLVDSDGKKIKNPNFNFEKTLDKIVI